MRLRISGTPEKWFRVFGLWLLMLLAIIPLEVSAQTALPPAPYILSKTSTQAPVSLMMAPLLIRAATTSSGGDISSAPLDYFGVSPLGRLDLAPTSTYGIPFDCGLTAGQLATNCNQITQTNAGLPGYVESWSDAARNATVTACVRDDSGAAWHGTFVYETSMLCANNGVDLSVVAVNVMQGSQPVAPGGTVAPGTALQINVVVGAIGLTSGESRSTTVVLQVGTQSVQQTVNLSDLQAGTITIPFSATFQALDSGAQTITATIDPGNTLNEVNLGNNSASETVVVSLPYAFSVASKSVPLATGAIVQMEPSYLVHGGCSGSTTFSERSFTVRCLNLMTGQAVNGCVYTATLSLETNPVGTVPLSLNRGGHDHGPFTNRPLGDVTPNIPSAPIAISGAVLSYRAPEISQIVRLTVTGTDPNGMPIPSTYVDLQIQVTGSDKWVPLSSQYVDVIENGADDDPSHELGYFGTPKMATAVSKMGQDFNERLNKLGPVPKIRSQAASLPFGGLYDINLDWETPHCGHRYGTNIDLSFKELGPLARAELAAAAKARGIRFYYAKESPLNSKADHWHGTLK